MGEADKKDHDRENFNPMQNINFNFVLSLHMIGYSNNDNNWCDECDSLKRIDKEYRNKHRKNSLIQSPRFIENCISS